MSIYISGSLAYDRIMTFPGHFRDHIIPEKLHIINISFMVERMEEKRGGCAGNIAYTLALLGEKPKILASVGKDFGPYEDFLAGLDLPLDGLRRDAELFTALSYVTTDLQGNQITGFYPGAMTLPCEYAFPCVQPQTDIALVSPGNLDDMRALPRYYRQQGVRYIYDPGQQIPVLTGEELLDAVAGSFVLAANDYELDMICKAAGKTKAELQQLTRWIVTTYGAAGCSVSGETHTDVPAVPPLRLADPTGAGDAHRAGILKGLKAGLSIQDAVRVGSTCASFAIEEYGAQMHAFDARSFLERHEAAFGKIDPAFLN